MGKDWMVVVATAALLVTACASERVLPARDATLVGDGWTLTGRAEATDEGTCFVALRVAPPEGAPAATVRSFDLRPGTERQQWLALPPEPAGRGLMVTAVAPPADAVRAPVTLRLQLVSPTARHDLPAMELPVWRLLPLAVLAGPVADAER